MFFTDSKMPLGDKRLPTDAKEGDVSSATRFIDRSLLLAVLFATVAMLTLATLAAAGGYFGDSIKNQAGKTEKEIKESPEYQALDEQAKAARAKVKPEIDQIDAEVKQVQVKLDEARREVVRANERLLAARSSELQLQQVSKGLHARVAAAALLSDRLAAERRAVLYDAHVDEARAATDAARANLEEAQSALASATQSAQAPSFAQGVGTLMGAASYHDNYVFPVGGGPQLVSVAHTHHDYPAADIAAPEGSPVYAISNAVVLNAWHTADLRCGIGLTIRTADGLVWTYCHLAFLEPSVVDGVSLAAGRQIGLVGSTGHASGPHLHLQLQPPTEFPQNQPWFQSFAGSAFTWQDAPTPTPLELPDATPMAPRVFSVVPDSRDAVIGFTRGGA